VKVSETVVKKAMSETDGSWYWSVCPRSRKEIAITEAILSAVAQNAEIMRILVDSEDELRITPNIKAVQKVFRESTRIRIISAFCAKHQDCFSNCNLFS